MLITFDLICLLCLWIGFGWLVLLACLDDFLVGLFVLVCLLCFYLGWLLLGWA